MGRKSKGTIMKKIFLFLLLLPFTLNAQYRALSRPDIIVKEKAWYDIRAYGAVGGDTTTDRSYIQAAIDSCGLDGGGVVYFPPETFIIDTTLFITRNNITLKGWQGVTTIQFAAGANDDRMVYIDSCSHITIDEIRFDNNAANQTGGEIRCIETVDSCYNITIKNCIFDDGARSGETGNFGIWLYECFDSNIDNIFVDGWDDSDFLVLYYSERIGIHNSIFKNLGGIAAITLHVGANNNIISNNFFYEIGDSTAAKGHAVASLNNDDNTESLWPRDNIISNNIARKCFGDVILVEDGFRYIISGNIIESYWTAAYGDTTGDTGISCSAEQSIIIGNHVSGNAAPGITLFAQSKYGLSYNMAAIGNICFNNGITAEFADAGIWLDRVRNCIVANNICGDNYDYQGYGIRLSGTSGYETKYNIISNNALFQNDIRSIGFTTYGDSSDQIVIANQEWIEGASTPDSVRISEFWQMGDIDPATFGGHKVSYTFYVDNIQDSVTSATQMESNGGEAKAYRLPYNGSILAIVLGISGTQSAGTLTTEVYINNTQTGLVATLSTALDAASATQRMDIDTFNAESALSVKYTTSNNWAPQNVDLYVTVIVEM